MERRIHFFVSRKNPLTWVMALCMVCSVVTRIAFPGVKGSGDTLYVWSQIVLPVVATLLYMLIALFNGKENVLQNCHSGLDDGNLFRSVDQSEHGKQDDGLAVLDCADLLCIPLH